MNARFFLSSLFVTFALSACGKNLDGGERDVVFIRSAMAPTTPVNGSCVFPPDTTLPALSEGALDVGVRDDYQLRLVLQSAQDGKGVTFDRSHVRVTDPDGTLIREYDEAISSFIDQPGTSVAIVRGVDAVVTDVLRASLDNPTQVRSIVTEVELHGHLAPNGAEVITPVFRFPIKVCSGCLVDFATGNDPAIEPQPNCAAPLPSGSRTPCAPGQDEAVPCQLCLARRACASPLQ